MTKFTTGWGLLLLMLMSGCIANSVVDNGSKILANVPGQIVKGQMLPISAEAKIAQQTIKLEVAQTPQQQAIGLMFRESLPSDRGMLFPFESPKIARFWMKNVLIPLDMVFIKGDRIVEIAVNVPPCKTESCPVYGPDALVDRVLELPGGKSQELGIKPGDAIAIYDLASAKP